MEYLGGGSGLDLVRAPAVVDAESLMILSASAWAIARESCCHYMSGATPRPRLPTS